MKRVYKYTLKALESQTLEMPAGALIRSIQIQDDRISLWAEIDPMINHVESVTILMFGTGWDIPDKHLEYIDTVQFLNGLVFHFYKLLK
ncbi:DUF7352 domain-containing protein [Sphingobacterium deserti]|uniref:DUF7352 domain-containing protein n=1 Tax=Sphingobacterium deserti TaxID=1229276 RepID=A0A0B8T1N2_9SPHI|nr:hypothetical protein [Sphingobacterium deserti]KGE14596.1 hypothetical protein DI53_1625 [Sphingobacterium deserti]